MASPVFQVGSLQDASIVSALENEKDVRHLGVSFLKTPFRVSSPSLPAEGSESQQITKRCFPSAICSLVRAPIRRTSLRSSKLARPCTFTADSFGSQRGLPKYTSPCWPRICEVRGATITRARAFRGSSGASTSTGRLFSIMPSSANQTSPTAGSIRAIGLGPLVGLFFSAEQRPRLQRNGKRQRLLNLDLQPTSD